MHVGSQNRAGVASAQRRAGLRWDALLHEQSPSAALDASMQNDAPLDSSSKQAQDCPTDSASVRRLWNPPSINWFWPWRAPITIVARVLWPHPDTWPKQEHVPWPAHLATASANVPLALTWPPEALPDHATCGVTAPLPYPTLRDLPRTNAAILPLPALIDASR